MKKALKEKVLHELKLFLFYTLFFTFFFSVFSLYHNIILKRYDLDYLHYGYSLFESMILAKIILIGQHFKFGEKFGNKPLIYPTLYKTLIFSLFVILFNILEHFVLGFFRGKNFETLYNEFINLDIYQIFAKLLVMIFVFILFFAFLEIGNALGEGKLYDLFFKPKKRS